MTTELTPAGLVVDTFEDTLESLEAEQLESISPALDLTTSSPLGQLNRLVARALAVTGEALQAIYAGLDPDSNSGDMQDRIAAITGSTREPAQAARVTLDLDLDPGTYPVGSLVAHITGRPTERFTNLLEVTGSGATEFEAEVAGEQQAPAGPALYVIAGPVSGWNSIGIASNSQPGKAVETDAAFRIRREQEIALQGGSSAAGIAADISANVPAVDSVTVLENDTSVTNADGLPPHSISAVVFGPLTPVAADNEAVAARILASKAAGISTFGNISIDLVDSQGVGHTINFSRPVDVAVDIYIEVEVTAAYPGDAAVLAVMQQRVLELQPGEDVTWSKVAAWTMSVEGTIRMTQLRINGSDLANGTITFLEKAVLGSFVMGSTPGVI